MNKKLARRAIRFLSVGGLATGVYWIALLGLSYFYDLASISASIIAYVLGFMVSYLGHRRITYNSTQAVSPELAKFLVVQGLCFALGNLVFWLLVSRMGHRIMVGAMALTATSVLVSYFASEFWAFKVPADDQTRGRSSADPPEVKP